MRLKDIFKGIDGEISGDAEIRDILFDSRLVRKGGLFFCLNGDDYAEDAIGRGAAAIVAESESSFPIPHVRVKDVREALAIASSNFYGRACDKLKIIGITGTNGKTTTSYMLASILKAAGKEVGVIGTLGGNFCGRVMPCKLTTPDPPYMHYIFSEMVKCKVEYCVMEVSAHALYYKKDAGINYTARIFTNLTRDHLDFFSDMTRYKEAKRLLFDGNKGGYSVVNVDDGFGREISANAVSYALDTPSDVFGIIEESSEEGSRVVINLNDELCECRINLPGRHNVLNALAAAACARREGVDLFSIADGLTLLKGVSGRSELAGKYNGGSIYVDYAHTPDALSKCASSLKELCRGKLICLFGCGGNRDRSKRKEMGRVASEIADFVIITSDNPRFENPADIIRETERGVKKGADYVCIEEREQAICYGISLIGEGDILLIAGKGAETYQDIMGIKYDYSDYTVIKKLIG